MTSPIVRPPRRRLATLLPVGVLGVALALADGRAVQAAAPGEVDSAAARLLEHTRVLASDAFEGRAPGSRGEDLTVAYLSEQFRRVGLQPVMPGGAWTQDVPIVGIRSEVDFSLAGPGGAERLQFPQDQVCWSPRAERSVKVPASEVWFVGYGVTAPEHGWDDFKGLDVRGKTLLILINDPPVPDPRDPARLDPRMFKGEAMTYYGRWTYKFEEAGRRGAAAAIIIHETRPAAYPWFVVVNSWGRERFDLQDGQGPVTDVAGWMSLERARGLLAANGTSYEALKQAAQRRDFQPVRLRETAAFQVTQQTRAVRSRNVLGLLEGRDPRRRHEWLVYTAHWDHLGRNGQSGGDDIFNGAADNALGTAGLLELARAHAGARRRPARSVLFLSVTAEEQGLLGAKYYAEHPVHPLARTLANINMDGLNPWGRTADLRQVGGGNSTLDEVLGTVARRRGRHVLPDAHPERGTFYRSDHFEFMKLGVPALYVKAGDDYLDRPAGFGEQKVTEYIERDYHKVTDEVKPDWDLSGAVEDLQVLYEVGRRLAEDRRWPAWRPGSEFRAAREASLKAAR